MPVGSSTNPFDDDDNNEIVTNENERVDNNINVTSTNPFDEEFGGVGDGEGTRDEGSGPKTTSFVNNNSKAETSLRDYRDDDFGAEKGVNYTHGADENVDDDDDDDDDEFEDEEDEEDEYYSPEASWQFLGELPYRKISLFKDVEWDDGDAHTTTIGLASYATEGLKRRHPGRGTDGFNGYDHGEDDGDLRRVLATTTVTQVAACPDGGPVALLTIPLTGGMDVNVNVNVKNKGGGPIENDDGAKIRLHMNSGRHLCTIDGGTVGPYGGYPYAASEVLRMGFTDRAVLVVILRDSTVHTYDLSGRPLLPPFAAFSTSSGAGAGAGGRPIRVMEATIFSGGAALLAETMETALFELLEDDSSDLDEDGDVGANLDVMSEEARYIRSAHPSARIVRGNRSHLANSMSSLSAPSICAVVVTPPTSGIARKGGAGAGSSGSGVGDMPEDASTLYYAMAVQSRHGSANGRPEIFLSTADCSVVVVDTATMAVTDMDCRSSMATPIVAMSLAPNGRFLACFTRGKVLSVVSTSFDTKVLDFDTSDGHGSAPRQMEWCGEDSVVMHWKALGILMVGPYGDWLRFPYPANQRKKRGQGRQNNETTNLHEVSALYPQVLHMVGERDGCRIVTDTGVDLLQRVPPSTAALLRIGSVEPAAMLLDASDAFSKGSPSADEAVRALVETEGLLEKAVEACLESAGKEIPPVRQRRLLTAASFGLHFLDDIGGNNDGSEGKPVPLLGGSAHGVDDVNDDDDDEDDEDEVNDTQKRDDPMIRPTRISRFFVQTAEKLRVLNALRRPEVGMATTVAQLDAGLTPEGLVARLTAVRRPALAYGMAVQLRLSRDVRTAALAARAANLIVSSKKEESKGDDDAAAVKRAVELLTTEADGIDGGGGAFASVAMAAYQAGRHTVADLFLRKEPNIRLRVQGLLATEDFGGAVTVAYDAMETDLTYRALMDMERHYRNLSSLSGNAPGGAPDNATRDRFYRSVLGKCPPEAASLLKHKYRDLDELPSFMGLALRGTGGSGGVGTTDGQPQIEAGCHMAERALQQPGQRETLSMLKEASRVFGLGKESAFYKSCTDDYLELLFEQERLRNAYKLPPFNPSGGGGAVTAGATSVNEFLVSILVASKDMAPQQATRLMAEVDRLAKKFRVPEKRLGHVKVRTLAATGQWATLARMGTTLSNTIGHGPLAAAVVKHRHSLPEPEKAEADIVRYVDRVPNPEERFDLYCEARLFRKALEEARKLRDLSRVMQVYTRNGGSGTNADPEIRRMCEAAASQLSA